MKTNRQKHILNIIKKTDIKTQDQLTSMLISDGYKVTQATVSRDIKELHIIKIPSVSGGYKYASAETDNAKVQARYSNIIKETVISVECANNLMVVKTFSGMAQAAAAAIDAMGFSGTLGSIAGDDTIIAVATDEEAAKNIKDKLDYIIINE